MNRMERLKAARDLAARFVLIVDEDQQGLGTWLDAVGRLGTELHAATDFFLPEAVRAQGRLIEIGDEDGTSPVACFQLLSRTDAMAISGTLYTHVVIELRKDPAFR